MLKFLLVVLVLSAAVHSLSVYSFRTYYEVFLPDGEDNEVNNDVDPPPHTEVAKMARYIVHNSDWAVLAFRSLQPKTNDFPMGAVQSVSDGPVGNSKGKPYMYVSELEDAVRDTEADNRCTLTMTLAQSDYCKQKQYDPKFPLCAQVWLVGRIHKIANGTEELEFAREALFSRHPQMKTWPKDHAFFFTKLEIERVVVQDFFEGPKYVDVSDYYKASP